MRRTTGRAGASLALSATFVMLALSSAGAETVAELPLSRLQLVIPERWTYQGGTDGADELACDAGALTVTVETVSSCADTLAGLRAREGAKKVKDWRPTWLPSGWTGVTWGARAAACRDRPGAASVVTSLEVAGVDGRGDALAALLGALAAGPVPGEDDLADSPVTLPATGVAVTLGGNTLLTSVDVANGYEVLSDATGHTVAVARRAGDCAAAVASAVTGDARVDASLAYRGWTGYRRADGGHVYCRDAAGSLLVVPQTATPELTMEQAMLDALSDHLEPIVLGAPQTGSSGWQIRVPSGYQLTDRAVDPDDLEGEHVNDDGRTYAEADADDDDGMIAEGDPFDHLVVPGDWPIRVVRAHAGCDALLATSTPYEARWVPPGWRAVRGAQLRFCADVAGGTIVVARDESMNPWDRRNLAAILAALLADNAGVASPTAAPDEVAAAEPAPDAALDADDVSPGTGYHAPRKPLLPVPLRLALGTVGTGDGRGFGGRIGVRVGTSIGDGTGVALAGEVGFDSETKLAHDVELTLSVGMVAGLAVVVAGGHDAWGTGADAAVPGAWYGGGGLRYHHLFTRPVTVEVQRLWRADGTPPAGEDGAGDEWRIGASVATWRRTLQAVTAEVRVVGGATTILVGGSVSL